MHYKHDLFFNNIPGVSKTVGSYLGFLEKSLGQKSFLTHSIVPYFIWTGTNSIKKLEKKRFSSKVKNKLKKQEIHIYLYEPLCLKIGKIHNRSFYSEFKHDTDLSTAYSEELDSIQKFINNNDLDNVKVFTSDYKIQLIQKQYPKLSLFCLDTFLRDMPYDPYLDRHVNVVTKKFWCGNWRYTPHRLISTAYLIQLDGNYSWNVQCSFSKLKENIWFDFDKLDPKRFAQLKSGIDILENTVFAIDQHIDAVEVDNSESVYIPGNDAPLKSDTFRKSYKECFCAVVNETRYAQPFGYFSEKTLTALNARLPIILVAPPKTLEYLKTFGFKTFNRWWDESYDQEEDHEKRMIMIFDLIDFINSKSIEELQVIYNEMQDTLSHNIEILKTIPYNSVAL